MQAVFFITLITTVIAIMSAIISGGSSNSAQLKASYIAETRDYFEAMAKVVLNDITRQNMHANPKDYTDVAEYVRNMPQLKQLSPGRTEDAASDAWGRPLQGRIYTVYETLQASGGINVTVPVTAMAFVSAGPDGVMQTTLPTVTQLNQVTGISAPAGSDDIVLTFHNRRAQEDLFASTQASLRRIGSAAVKELQGRLADHRQKRLKVYQQDISAGKPVNIDMLDVTQDVDAPRFLKLDDSEQGLANRRSLGVDGDFNTLERTVNGGRMEVIAAAPASLAAPLVLRIRNTGSPTPWGKPANSFNYQIEVTAIQ